MNITHEQRQGIMDTAIESWYITSYDNEYRLQMELVGAIDDDGNQINDCASMAYITLTETKRRIPLLMDKIEHALNDISSEMMRGTETIMQNAPDVREYILLKNESSYYETCIDLKNLFNAVMKVLTEEEISRDIGEYI